MQPGKAMLDANDAVRLADQDPSRAIPLARRAAGLARRERDLAAGAIAERALGHALVHHGDMAGANRAFRRSIALGNQVGSAVLAAEARMKLAYVLVQRGQARAALAEIDAALPVLDGAVRARAVAQRAFILHQAGRLDEALAEYDTALLDQRDAGDLLGTQRSLTNRAMVLTDRYAFAAAEADLLEAGRLATQLGLSLPLGIIAENLSLVEGLRGNIPAALAHLERAELIITQNRAALGTVLRDRAELLLSAGLLTEARTAAERAVATCRREHRLLKVPEVRLLLAQAAALERDWPAALDQARRAAREFTGQHRDEWAALARLEVLRARLELGPRGRVSRADADAVVDAVTVTGWPAVVLEARLLAGRVALRHGGEQAGLGHLRAAAAAGRGAPAVLRARSRYARALLRHSHGDPQAAVRAARSGLAILDEHSAALGAADLRAHSAVHRRELAELGLRIALDGGRPARVFEWAERGRASQLLSRPVRPPEDPVLALLLSELRATVAAIDRSREAGGRAGGLVQHQVELERRIRDRNRLRTGSAVTGRPAGPSPVRPGQLGRALGERALVEFVEHDGALYALTLVRERLRLRTLGASAAVAALIERLPFALHRMARLHADAQARRAAEVLLRHAAAGLDDLLLRPLAELDDRPLVVVPTGLLHSMPWSILPSCAGRPVTVAASASVWHSTGERAAVAAGAAGVAVAAGPGLPGAREEARAVAAIHRTIALVDAAATVDAVLASFESAGIAHVAAHGRLSADNPLFSNLQLADGPLVVYDLERLHRVPHTVVLAACESGRSVVRAGDELLGLSATFIAGGAAQLVASVLPVPDAETAPLMVAFHHRLAAGQPPAIALADAQHQLRGDEQAVAAAAAGFVCLGSGGAAATAAR